MRLVMETTLLATSFPAVLVNNKVILRNSKTILLDLLTT